MIRPNGPHVDPAILNEWMQAIATTEEDEIDCAATAAVIHQVVEAAATGTDVREFLPAVAVHIGHCPNCRDLYETLLAITQDDAF